MLEGLRSDGGSSADFYNLVARVLRLGCGNEIASKASSLGYNRQVVVKEEVSHEGRKLERR